MSVKYFVANVVLAVASVSAHAGPDDRVVEEMLKRTSGISAEDIRRDYDACDSGVTFSMKLCAAYRWIEQDIRLNSAYKRLREQTDKGDASSLVNAERAWLAYRDAECAFEGKAGAGGGTAEGLYVLSCKEVLTRQQADRLAAFGQN